MTTKAYHATSKHAAIDIIKQQVFFDSTDDNEWLGSGVYFFQSIDDARIWCRDTVARREKTCTVILSVTLSCADEQYYDLEVPGHMGYVIELYEHFISDYKHINGFEASYTNEQSMCLACNLLIEAHKEMKIISHSFPELKENATKFKVVISHRQYSVIDKSCISNIEQEESDDDYAAV